MDAELARRSDRGRERRAGVEHGLKLYVFPAQTNQDLACRNFLTQSSPRKKFLVTPTCKRPGAVDQLFCRRAWTPRQSDEWEGQWISCLVGWFPHNSREWIELIIVTVLLWLLMMAIFELELNAVG